MAARATIAAPSRASRRLQPRRKPLSWTIWTASLAGVFVFILALVAYSPAVGGPFVFDDLFLPFKNANAYRMPFMDWITGVRPILMVSYWLNYQSAGTSPSSYHIFNIAVHSLNTAFVWLVAFAIFGRAGVERNKAFVLACMCSLLFLLHPLQTESVAYVAGRSESLGACFFLIGYTVFVCRRREAVSWPVAVAIFVFFGLALFTKENMLALGPTLLLTDLFWNGDGAWRAVRANWRLYLLIGAAAVPGLWFVGRVLATAQTAGFNVPGTTWYQYLFTETRAIFAYIFMFLFPSGQSADHDFPISHSVFEYGAVVSLTALLGCVAAALIFRKHFPLASFGFLLFLVLLGPTSSFIPISDAFVERRMYLPVLALCFVVAEGLSRREVRRWTAIGATGIILCLLWTASYHRAAVWSTVDAFWSDTVARSPAKGRAYWNLAQAAVTENQCELPVQYLHKADAIIPRDPYVLASWAKVLGCKHKYGEALVKLKTAETVAPDSALVFDLEGLLYGQMDKLDEAKAAFEKAIALNSSYVDAYSDRGLWYEYKKLYAHAAADYRTALALAPFNLEVRTGLARVQQEIRQDPGSSQE